MSDIFGPNIEGAALGTTGLKQLSPDFDKKKFTDLIETKGYRLAWSRASICPCKSVDLQTKNSDPNCELCQLVPGFTFFRPEGYDPEEVDEAGDLSNLQKHIINREGSPAVVIRGTITSVLRTQESYAQIGDWVFGSFNVTVRPENRIGYYDRIVLLDSLMPYSQIVTLTEKRGPVSLRFPAKKISFCRSVDKLYKEDVDFTINSEGQLVFDQNRRPEWKSRLAVHYDHHPQFIIIEHVNCFRDSMLKVKDVAKRETPVGNLQTLPIRAVAKLEFLLDQG